MLWQVYIIECRGGFFYTGITNDLERRVSEHNRGLGCRFTRIRRPVRLLYSELAANRSQATKREHQIKKFSKDKKIQLIGINKTRRMNDKVNQGF